MKKIERNAYGVKYSSDLVSETANQKANEMQLDAQHNYLQDASTKSVENFKKLKSKKYLEIDLAGGELLAGKSTKIEWFKPVFADDILTSTCTVSKLTKRNEKNGIVELTFEALNQNGELVLTDVTEMIVKCKPIK